MLTALGNRARRWAGSIDPWTNVYGVARTLLALGTALTLAFSHSNAVFAPVIGVARVPICDGMARIGFFCWFGGHHLELARWVAVALLLVVASGWRPRLPGLVHWWIAFSFQASATLIEGGDQATAILALLLVPVTLLDARRWHWQPAPAGEPGERDASCRLVALTALLVIRVQVA